jgi:glycosyltransferase involved in cell wall biosynthesis
MVFLLKNKRIKIGIPFSYSSDWIGGIYYIYNTVNALSKLKNPNIDIEFLIEKNDDITHLESNINYANWNYRFHGISRISKFEKLLFRLFKIKPLLFRNINFLYLFSHKSCFNYFPSKRIIYWVGDLQNHYFPQYFDSISLQKRTLFQDFLATKANKIIATSNAMKNEFREVFPNSNVNIKVVQFSVTATEIGKLDYVKFNVLEKFNIMGKYYYSPNQFWAHKNHMLLIESFKTVVERKKYAKLIFTGRESDSRNPDFFNSVKNRVNELALQDNIYFLGFIPRLDQLLLMKNAHAIVQPSLYEGWSTVIEDSKILGKKVIASDLSVHREQLNNHGVYFNPNMESELSNLLIEYFEKDSEIIDYNYDAQISNSAISFIDCFQ